MNKSIIILFGIFAILASYVKAQPNVFPGAGGAPMPNFVHRPVLAEPVKPMLILTRPLRIPGQGFAGGYQQQNLEDSTVRSRAEEFAQFVADQRTAEEQTPYVVTRINSYSVQQVNGRNHRLQLVLSDGESDTVATAVVHEPFRGPNRLSSYFSFRKNSD